MTETTLGNLGLHGNFAAGAEGWDIDLNQDLRMADTLIFGTVLAAPQNDPPGAPNLGDTYIVGTAPTGAWASNANAVAVWTKIENDTTVWEFYTPKTGWTLTCYVGATPVPYLFKAGAWAAVPAPEGFAVVSGATTLTGIGTVIIGPGISATAGAAGTITLGAAGGTGGATTLQALTDVNVEEGDGIDGDLLAFDSASSKWVALPRSSLRSGGPLNYHSYTPGTLTAGQHLATFDVAPGEAANFAANLAGSILKADVASGASATDFTVSQNGTLVASGVIPPDSSVGTLTSGTFTTAGGDTISFDIGETCDGTLSGVRFALHGTLQ